MKRIVTRAGFIAFGLMTIVVLGGGAIPKPALEALKAEAPSATWEEKGAVQADVTCDGIADTVMLGREKDAVWIGVVRGVPKGAPNVQPIAASFSIGGHSQDSFCAYPVRIKLYPHECDGGEYGRLENCKPAKGCKDFSVQDDECDSFNFYWLEEGKMTWWRN